MSELLQKLSECIEFGKINKASPFPPEMKDQDGADELTKQALDEGLPPNRILYEGMIPGMDRVGKKFAARQIFVPHMLMAARAMSTAMAHLKPFFQSGEVKRKGTFVIGTVRGDLHDIGKNLVGLIVEGAGWEVIDLGTDVSADQFARAVGEHPGASVGLSALLTTTMVNMEDIVQRVKGDFPGTHVLVGGAPVTTEFCERIGADYYAPDPSGAVQYLNSVVSSSAA